MQDPSRWRRYLGFWGPDPVRDVDDELSFHLELKRQELRSAGVPPAELESALAREFGDRQRIERELREIGMKRLRRARRANLLEEAHVDLLHAWRSFRRRPAVPLLVVLILGLGIGASTAVFTLIDAVVLNPLAVREADNLLVLERRHATTGARSEAFSYPMLQALDEPGQHLVGVAGRQVLSVGTRAGDHAEQASAVLVTGGYFNLLGIHPQRGRLLLPSDDAAPGAAPYVVVSDAYWRRALGGDPGVIGRSLQVNEATLEIVGVAPPRFRGTDLGAPVDLWIPLSMINVVGTGSFHRSPEALADWRFVFYDAMARVQPGSSADAALAELTARHNAAVEANWPVEPGRRLPAATVMAGTPLNEAAAGRSREDLIRFLRMLAAVVAACLAVACINVANLLLIRATERTGEMSVRAALGGNRARLMRQLLLEGVVLALAAGAAGVLVALGGLRLVTAFSLPGGIALRDIVPGLDLRVLGFALTVSLLCAIIFGMAPAVAGSRANVMETLRQSAHGKARNLLRGGTALVSVQVALSLVLLVSAFLFIRSLQAALAVDLGYRSDGIASVAVGLEQHGYDRERAAVFINDVLEHARAQPGIAAVSATEHIPLDPTTRRLPLEAQGGADGPTQRHAVVSAAPGYLDVLGIPILRGRGLAETDVWGSPRVAVITEGVARSMWPDGDALGRQFVIYFGEPWTVVGIVPDAHFTRLSDREPHVFLPLAQGAREQLHIIARGDNAAAVLSGLRSAVRRVDDRVPTFREGRFGDQLNTVLMTQRFGGALLGAFGLIALLISAIGIYAVTAYEVARRRRELGIRAALGADARALARAVLTRSGTAIVGGVVAGLVLAALTTQALRGLLFGITTYEPMSYFAAAAVLALTAILASWVPARRAARVDPLTVIRE